MSASGVSPKWVKSNERKEREREKEDRRAKVSVDNGQYLRLNILMSFVFHCF